MPVAELLVPSRLLAGGGPGSPDPRVLRALVTPLIGQFDPDFTAIMDQVMQLARGTFLTRNARCFPVSGLAAAGLEALLKPGDRVAIGGGPSFVADTAEVARRYGADVVASDEFGSQPTPKLVVVPLVDATSGTHFNVRDLANATRAAGARLIVEATHALGCLELRVDDWQIDACVAGVDHALGAPSGMALVTYTSEVEAIMHARRWPPRTSYLDLLQVQAYWSAERLNHHTAPTSLVYGLREACVSSSRKGSTRAGPATCAWVRRCALVWRRSTSRLVAIRRTLSSGCRSGRTKPARDGSFSICSVSTCGKLRPRRGALACWERTRDWIG